MKTALRDDELLSAYAKHGDGDAFGELAARYVDFVYSTALRITHNGTVAEDVTQSTFILLARKPSAVTRGRIGGWLCLTTRNIALNELTKARRRRRHEEAKAMQTSELKPDCDPVNQSAGLLANLDGALASLGQTDREIIILRYFRGMTIEEIGKCIGLSDAASRRRANRAVEKLRRYFGRSCSASMATSAICSAATVKAPTHLRSSILKTLWPHGSVPALSVKKALVMTIKMKAAAILTVVGVTAGIGGMTVWGISHLRNSTIADNVPLKPSSADHTICLGRGIGSIEFGMTRDQVIAKLGQPEQELGGPGSADWLSQSISAIFTNEVVPKLSHLSIGSVNPTTSISNRLRLGTADGVSLGSSESDVLRVYGPPDKRSDADRGFTFLSYWHRGAEFKTNRDHQVALVSLFPTN